MKYVKGNCTRAGEIRLLMFHTFVIWWRTGWHMPHVCDYHGLGRAMARNFR